MLSASHKYMYQEAEFIKNNAPSEIRSALAFVRAISEKSGLRPRQFDSISCGSKPSTSGEVLVGRYLPQLVLNLPSSLLLHWAEESVVPASVPGVCWYPFLQPIFLGGISSSKGTPRGIFIFVAVKSALFPPVQSLEIE